MEQPDDRLPAPDGLNDDFEVSESLVPMRDLKAAEQNTVSFDGLLAEPLILKEDLKEGCGGQLWPAGMVLAKYLLRRHRSDLSNKTIIELGAGGGLVGLAVARGCNIGKPPLYITDQAPMLPLMETNIKINNLASTVVAGVLNWGEPIPDLIPSHPAVILAADCVYFEPAFPLLISTLGDLLGPESVCYFCFKRRRRADLRFMKMARKAFEVEIVTDDPEAEAYGRENISIFSIRPKQSEARP
ncbi:Protein-lysine N-methyltransferase efm6 [Aspergillus melleus]|uniref:Protein-lysine N-methyltransferase efm6 n=1 Tax=Aspergillus melleus TaxID=138277 RepID=UPI001E8CB0FB|nr:Protein-lysine N-methyltransferase efm6 [Aspergillus melleus]KAH8425668.1 Protein-lysine N-methyltransferase efm6 [Aspergillus melleus]